MGGTELGRDGSGVAFALLEEVDESVVLREGRGEEMKRSGQGIRECLGSARRSEQERVPNAPA